MNELLKILNQEEKQVLKQMNIKSDDLAYVEESISEYMMNNFMKDDELTKNGIICENILNKIGSLD